MIMVSPTKKASYDEEPVNEVFAVNELYPSQELDGHREDSLQVSTEYNIDNK